MISRNELDAMLDVYQRTRHYVDTFDRLEMFARNDEDGDKKVRKFLEENSGDIFDLIDAVKVINKAYKTGDYDTKLYISRTLAEIHGYKDPKDGDAAYTMFLGINVVIARLRKKYFELNLNKLGIEREIPPIPRKAKKSSAKTRKRKTPTKKSLPTAKRFSENLIKTAMRLGGFNR